MGGGESHIKREGMLFGKFQLNPLKVPIWVWVKLSFTPKRYRSETYTNKQLVSMSQLIAIKIKVCICRCLYEMPFNQDRGTPKR